MRKHSHWSKAMRANSMEQRTPMYVFLWIIFAFLSAINTAQAYQIAVEPKFLFRDGFIGPPTMPFRDTAAEAFTDVQAYMAKNCIPSSCVTADNFRPQPAGLPFSFTLNGVPYYYVWDKHICSGASCQRYDDGGLTAYMFCPDGFGLAGQSGSTNEARLWACIKSFPDIEPPPKNCDSCIGNPIYAATGQKLQVETDYSDIVGLGFTRTYRSTVGSFSSIASGGFMDLSQAPTTPTGSCYQSFYTPDENTGKKPYCFPYISTGQQNYRLITRDGRFVQYSGPNNAVTANADINDKVVQVTNASGQMEWRVTRDDDSTETYNSAGLLISKVLRGGQTFTFIYSDAGTPTSIAPRPGLLLSQTDAFGHSLTWRYNSAGIMSQMIDPAGGTYQYNYDAAGNLTGVTYPDGSSKGYAYNEAAYTSGTSLPRALTGIVDESGVRFATFAYDSSGRGISTEHAGGVEKFTFSYGNSQTTVVDPQGTTKTYNFQTILNVAHDSSQTQPASLGSGTVARSYTYDVNGNITSKADFNGNVTSYAYDLSRNLETSRTEASGTAQARTITTQWHTQYRLPLLISIYTGSTATGTPVETIAYTYDASGNQLSKTTTDPAAGTSRTWSYTYNNYGQVLTADGPRTDVNDVTTYTYYTCNTGYQCGQVQSITNALGYTTTYNTYNAAGQPLTITDANGTVTTLAYDARQRLTSRMVGTDTTLFAYWPTGLLRQVTLPNGSAIQYGYDAAHRLTTITDSDGSTLTYTLDAAGNRTQEVVKDAQGAVVRTHSRVFNALSQLYQDIGAANQTTTYAYDNNGNVTGMTDPLNRSTTYQYDALNRLKTSIDPLLNPTNYGYDANDNLRQVTDPKGLTTSYAMNGLGDLTQLQSPDTQTTAHTYDAAGNLATRTDARGQVTTFTYDALNRVIQQSTPDQSILYQYDQGPYGKGHLTGVSDANHSITYQYDALGHITSKTQVLNNRSLTTSYVYSLGRLVRQTTPNGNVITYDYSNGKLSAIQVNNQPVIIQVRYAPFGQTEGWTWGNNTNTVRGYDQDGRISVVDSAGATLFTYHPDGTIATQTKDDSVQLNLGTGPTNFTHAATSNRLTNASGALTRSYQYDAAGNTLSDGTRTFTYNGAGRLTSATQAGQTTQYLYNALGQRIQKANASGTTLFAYDEQGHLIGEYDQNGLIQEIVWLNDIPVATIRTDQGGTGTGVFYIHTDHLNSPTKVTRPTNNEVIWRWDHDAYGNGTPNEDPDGNNAILTLNLRYPGQYLDNETGLYYNYFRYYDPIMGRYVQSDPMGQQTYFLLSIAKSRHKKGYWNHLYNYVDSNPLAATDPFGLGMLDWLIDLFNDKAPEEAINSTLGSLLSTLCIKQNCGKKNRSSVELWGDCAQILGGFLKENGPGMAAAIGGVTGDAAQGAIADCAERCGEFLRKKNTSCSNCAPGDQK